MLRLRPLELLQPPTVAEAVALMAEHGDRARLISGGTDLMPNLKLAQVDAEVLVSLRGIESLRSITRSGDSLTIGARARLVEIAESPVVQAAAPVLSYAVGRIASPQIRNMGTMGGNICLDTRCRYINQSELFREALGGCLKSHGTECHVVPGGQGCVAALSSDAAPVLIALGAEVEIVGADGERMLPMSGFYNTDGLANTNLRPGEVVTSIKVPVPGPAVRLAYRKWAVRQSIDFPLVSVAVRVETESADSDVLVDGLAVVGVLGPKPKKVPLKSLAGGRLGDALARQIGALVRRKCRPLPNVPYDAEYRRDRLAVEARRAILEVC